jgi:PAS domain S-box-containing protein
MRPNAFPDGTQGANTRSGGLAPAPVEAPAVGRVDGRMELMSTKETSDELAGAPAGVADPLFIALADALHDRIVIRLDDAGRILRWPAPAERLMGFDRGEVEGQPYLMLVASPALTPIRAILAQTQTHGRWATERWWRSADGGLRWIAETLVPVHRNGDGPVEFLLVLEDRTGRESSSGRGEDATPREAAALARESHLRGELRAAEWRAAFLAEASSILVASSLSFEGTTRGLARLAVSRLAEWCLIHALDPQGVIRRLEFAHRDPRAEEALAELRQGGFRPEQDSPLVAVLRTGVGQILGAVPKAFVDSLVDTDEQAALLAGLGARSVMVVPLLGRGRVLGALTLVDGRRDEAFDEDDLGLAEELARRAAIAIDNARLYREAQEANRAKADFLAIMSHELRTPLNAIMGYSDLLDAEISGPVTGAQRRQIGRVRASARHLLQLIEEILAYARMESGSEEMTVEHVRAEEVAAQAVASMESLAIARQLRLELHADGRTSISTDVGKLRQILVSLISNAIKFTDAGGVDVRVITGDDSVRFEIIDSGIGLSPDQIQRVFEPFWQAEPPTTRRAGGTGLGLSVARRYARLLGGDITARSESDGGATFVLELPRQPAAASSAAPHDGIRD